jgi:hypothetical protein
LARSGSSSAASSASFWSSSCRASCSEGRSASHSRCITSAIACMSCLVALTLHAMSAVTAGGMQPQCCNQAHQAAMVWWSDTHLRLPGCQQLCGGSHADDARATKAVAQCCALHRWRLEHRREQPQSVDEAHCSHWVWPCSSHETGLGCTAPCPAAVVQLHADNCGWFRSSCTDVRCGTAAAFAPQGHDDCTQMSRRHEPHTATVKLIMFRMQSWAAPSKQPFNSAPKRSLLTLLARASRTCKCR